MPSAVLEALESSTAHGVSKVAGSKSPLLRLMWTVLFLTFIGFFCSGAVNLLQKLRSMRVVRTYQNEKVPFELPDIYFCPSHPFSGSFPYTLSRSDAELVNKEVKRLSTLYDEMISHGNWPKRFNKTSERVRIIVNSLPVHLMKNYLMHRPEQSIFDIRVKGGDNISTRLWLTSTSWVCFQVVLPDDLRREIVTKRLELRVGLFIDPHFSDFVYSGYPIKPIVNPRNNNSVPLCDWQPFSGIREDMFRTGFQMMLAPRGSYPSWDYDAKFKLAPGRSYEVTINMEEVAYSEELQRDHCSFNHDNATFEDQLTGQRVEYNHSYPACLYTQWSKHLHKAMGITRQRYPRPWNMRHTPRQENLTEVLAMNRSALQILTFKHIEDVPDHCKRYRPCVHHTYSTGTFSFWKWPGFRTPYAAAFSEFTEKRQPALAKLARVAAELDKGNHSAHTEAAFRHFVSESMLEVRIKPESSMAPQVLIAHSYSLTAFLADMGGLLGLYIGSSLLTICELFELIYILVAGAVHRASTKHHRAAKESPVAVETNLNANGDTFDQEGL